MPDIIKQGPLSVQAGAAIYAVGLNGRLRNERGWRKNIIQLLQDEYGDFARLAMLNMFGVQDMWEYAWLVDATDTYLSDKKSKTLWAWFHSKACRDLFGINECLKKLEFSEQEKESLRRAFERMAPIIKRWGE